VARQYCGQLGKQDNYQIAVCLSVANGRACLADRLLAVSAGAVGQASGPARRSILPDFRSARKLRTRLARWCGRSQKSFDTEIDLDAFAADGRAIARAVKAELPGWSIVYFDEAAAARADYQGAPAEYEIEMP
jgi:hypothetical protein